MLRLNIGAGRAPNPDDGEWLRIDIDPGANPDIVHDICDPLPFEDGAVDAIFSAHCLEHAPYPVVGLVLADWARVLRLGGLLELRIPHMNRVMCEYVDRAEKGLIEMLRAQQACYGGMTGINDSHIFFVSADAVIGMLLALGFVMESVEAVAAGTKVELRIRARRRYRDLREAVAELACRRTEFDLEAWG